MPIFGGDIETVAEREKRVGRHHRARDLSPSSLAFMAAMRLDTTRLIWPAPTPMRHALFDVDDGVGFDVLAHLPCKQQVGKFLFRRQALGHDAQIAFADATFVARLHEQATIDAAVFMPKAGRGEPASHQHADVFLARADLERVGVDFGRNDQLDELTLDDGARRVRIERTVERDDAAECRRRVRAIRTIVRSERVTGDGDAAGIRMLHDHARGLVELSHAFECGIAIGDVVVRELLALQLLRGADARAGRIGDCVERGGLMRILAVTQIHALAEMQRQGLRIFLLRALLGLRDAKQITCDRRVIARRVRIRLRGETLARLLGDDAIGIVQLIEHGGVIRRIDDHRDAIMILRGGAHHRGATDVDVLDRVFVSAIGLGDGGRERIKIHHHQIDRIDAMRAHDGVVDVATAEQAAMNFRMQCLDATIHDFRKAGVRGHLRHLDAMFL